MKEALFIELKDMAKNILIFIGIVTVLYLMV